MSCPEAGIGNSRHLAAFRLLVSASFAFLLLALGGVWTPAQAVGPALWIASPTGNPQPPLIGGIVEVRPSQLLVSGRPHRVKITDGLPLDNATGLAFRNGALWVTTLNNTVLKFTKWQLENLSTRPHPHPKVTITSSSSFMFNIGCVFDAQGNLWVIDSKADGVHEISQAQLAAGSADITPVVTITTDASSTATSLASPSFGAFDTAGNLWVSSLNNHRIVEFSASQLATPGATVQVPNIVITSASLDDPGQLQFDTSGNLWVTSFLDSTVVEFTPGQLLATGSPTATVVLSDDGFGSLSTPWGLQFDAFNRLWVSNYGTGTGTGTIVKFGPAQLSVTGSPTPRITLTGLPQYAGQITFGPRH